MARFRSGRLFPVLLMLFLALGTFWLERVVQLPDGPGRPKRHEPDFTVENFTLTQMNKEGAADTLLTARRMVHFADDESTTLESPRMIQNKEGDPPLQVVARSGTVDKDGNVVQLMDDVVATRPATAERPEMRLRTQFIEIHIPEEIGTTPDKVVITQGNSVLTGVGMVFRNKTREFELHADVHGTYVKENPDQQAHALGANEDRRPDAAAGGTAGKDSSRPGAEATQRSGQDQLPDARASESALRKQDRGRDVEGES